MGLVENIKNIKRQKGLTSEDVAKKAEISLGALNKILSGETRNPSAKTVNGIAAALDVTVEELLNNNEEITSDKYFPMRTMSEDEFIGELHHLLVEAGYIQCGKDITRRQFEVLSGIIQILDASFKN